MRLEDRLLKMYLRNIQKNIVIVKVSSNMTDHMQPLDLSVNRPAKKFLKINTKIGMQTAECIRTQLAAGLNPENIDVDLRLTAIREVRAMWVIALCDYLSNECRDIIVKRFVKAGIHTAIGEPLQGLNLYV